MRTTITEALRLMRGLHTVDAGRLHGVDLRYRHDQLLPHRLTATPQPWRDRLQHALTTGRVDGEPFNPETPRYLVFSHQTVVAVLTTGARVVLPDYPLTAVQTRHQTAAAAALNDLHRHTLATLADQRARAENRHHDRDDADHPDGSLRVAPVGDLTRTTWLTITADPADTRRRITAVCGTDPDQTLIITAVGYGRYGRWWHRLDLDVLTAMHQIAGTHEVPLQVVGDWLDPDHTTGHAADAGPHAQPDPTVLVRDFAATYAGTYPDQLAYTRQRMNQLGWTVALQHAGIPDRYLDLQALARDWFTEHVHAISHNGHQHRGIAVFHRHAQQESPPTPPETPDHTTAS